MSEPLVREIAQQIVRNELLLNAYFYLLLIALLFLSSVGSAFLVAYIRKRAEALAAKADHGELIAQLRATTEAAEGVKLAIAHADWAAKEWKTIRRTKLEELLASVYAVENWIAIEKGICLFNSKKENGPSPIAKVQMLALLYFPELSSDVTVLAATQHELEHWLVGIQARLLMHGKDSAAMDATFAVVQEEWPPRFRKLLRRYPPLHPRHLAS